MKDLALVFLKLGFTAFGGPAAHIAMMENEFVRRRQWLSHQEFLDLLGASNLIPGPGSSELAIFIGQKRAGWRGLLLVGTCFILPAALIVVAIAWAYAKYNSLPAVSSILYGIKPVIVAVVLQAVWTLGRTAVKTKLLFFLGCLVILANILGLNIPLTLLCAGMLSAYINSYARKRSLVIGSVAVLSWIFLTSKQAFAASAIAVKTPVTLTRIFLFFLKVGAIQFGSGYVLLAFLRDDLVKHWHWLTEAQLLDATAVGQFTPGPVFTTATFIGYLLHGNRGAIVATIGIFLPAFLLVAASATFIPRLRKSQFAGAFLDGVNVASLALMVAVTFQLGQASLFDVTTILLAVASAIALIRFRVSSAWLILAGGVVGFVVQGLKSGML